MSSRTVLLGESAESLLLKKEIEFLSKMIRNHKAQQQSQRVQRTSHYSQTKPVSMRAVYAPKASHRQVMFPYRTTFKPPTYPKGYANGTRTHFVKQTQPQTSKYKLVKTQSTATPAPKRVVTPKTPQLLPKLIGRVVTPKTQQLTPKRTGSIQFASRQPSVFSKTQRTTYKLVNRNLTPARSAVQRMPSRTLYSGPYGHRNFRKPGKYSYSSAFLQSAPFLAPWYRYRRNPHVYRQPTKRYKVKCKKRAVVTKSQIVSIGGLWYRASQTKLSRTSTPVNKKVLHRRGSPRLITVMGVKYQMDSNGTALRRIAPKGGTTPVTPKSRIDVGGHTYVKNATGVFMKTPTTEKRMFASRAVSRSIYHIQMNHHRKAWRKNNQHCMFYMRFGKCHKGTRCQYVHDPEKVAVCTRFLRGTCKVSQCPFSHKISPDKMPVCSYFLQGRCSSDNCPYRHVKVNPSAGICKNFIRGHCPQGTKCKERHVSDCPDLKQNGSCSKKDCPFRHRKRKGPPLPALDLKKKRPAEKPKSEGPAATDVGSLPSFIALPSISPEIDQSCQQESGKSQLQIRPRFLKMS